MLIKIEQKGGIICKNSPKTDAGNRRVAVPISTLEGLREFHQEMSLYFEEHHLPRSKLIFPTIYGNYMCDRNERATLKTTYRIGTTKLWVSPIPTYTCLYDAQCRN